MSFLATSSRSSPPRARQVRLSSNPQHAKVADEQKTCQHEQEEQHAHQRAYLITARAPSAPTTSTNTMPRRRRRRRKSRQIPHTNTTAQLAVVAAISILPSVAAQTTCIPLNGSSACPAFTSSSISTNPYLVGLFPFLSTVTDLTSFDAALQDYVTQGYVESHYISLFGCSAINLTNTTAVYARYTTSFLCNAIIQNSIEPCGLSTSISQPLCADSCANFALSEQTIVSTPSICGTNPSPYAISQLRADFTNCALPANAITGTCIPAYLNEGTNCGFQNNLEGLCTYCSGSTVNSTDSCCVESQVETRCQGVRLPAFTSLGQLFTTTVSGAGTTVTATPTGVSVTSSTNGRKGLSAGQIAGIVVGSVLGGLLLLALLICGGLLMRRRRKERDEKEMMYGRRPPPAGSIPPPMTHTYQASMPPTQAQARPPGGGRVVGMTAHQHTNDSPRTGTTPSTYNQSTPESFPAAGIASIPRRRDHTQSQQRYDGSSPSPTLGGPGIIAGGAGHQQSPEGSQESEQMESFKDYYSSQDIHVGDLVSVLWAYQPRADDELPLERGEMLRIVGIWDDGWATAVRVDGMNAENWDPSVGPGARDSVVGGFGGQGVEGQVKAVPLVCVCLPHYWRKAIEGESSADEPRTSEEEEQRQQQARESTYEDHEPEDYDHGAAVGTALGEPSRRGGAQMGVHPALRPELP